MSLFHSDATFPEKVSKTTKEMEETLDLLVKKSKKEEKFLKKAEKGQVEPNKLETNLEDFIIFLDEDIAKKLKKVEKSLKGMESDVETETEAEILERLEKALGVLEKEETRFRNVLQKAEKHEEKHDMNEEEIAHEVEKFEHGEFESAMEQARTELRYCESKIKDKLKQ